MKKLVPNSVKQLALYVLALAAFNACIIFFYPGAQNRFDIDVIVQSNIPDFIYPVWYHPQKPKSEQEEIGRLESVDRLINNAITNGSWSLTGDHVFAYDPQAPWWRTTNASRTLFVRPVSGMGNHLQTIASALTLARVENFDVKIVFDRMGKYIKFDDNFRWNDLFREPPLDYNDTFPGGSTSVSSECTVHYAYLWHEVRDMWERGRQQMDDERLCIRACCLEAFPVKSWLPHTGWFYRSLKPSHRIEKMIKLFQKEVMWDKYTWVGVHIRRTDRVRDARRHLRELPLNTYLNLDTSNYDDVLSIAAFVDQMQNFLDSVPNEMSSNSQAIKPIRFFLATDDEDVRDRVMKSFEPNLVVEVPNKMNVFKARSKKEGMEQAVMDLVLLAYCRVLIGSPYSSFSKAANFMGNNFFTEPGFTTTWEHP